MVAYKKCLIDRLLQFFFLLALQSALQSWLKVLIWALF